jgi:hypothetical protein
MNDPVLLSMTKRAADVPSTLARIMQTPARTSRALAAASISPQEYHQIRSSMALLNLLGGTGLGAAVGGLGGGLWGGVHGWRNAEKFAREEGEGKEPNRLLSALGGGLGGGIAGAGIGALAGGVGLGGAGFLSTLLMNRHPLDQEAIKRFTEGGPLIRPDPFGLTLPQQ